MTAATLVGSAALTGGLTGFAAGVLWALLGLPAAGRAAWVMLVAAALADLAGRPRPLAVGRQVPQEWGRLLEPPVAALLYGARLGVGPLTILSTWLWWAALVLALSAGPWTAAWVGAAFGGVRGLSMVAVAQWAQAAMPARMARLRRGEPVARWAAVAAALALAAALP